MSEVVKKLNTVQGKLTEKELEILNAIDKKQTLLLVTLAMIERNDYRGCNIYDIITYQPRNERRLM